MRFATVDPAALARGERCGFDGSIIVLQDFERTELFQ
jgi:hypothetical protein